MCERRCPHARVHQADRRTPAAHSAPEDLDNPSALHSLLLELRHIRLAKIRHALRPAALSSFALGGGADGQSGTLASRADTGSFSGGATTSA